MCLLAACLTGLGCSSAGSGGTAVSSGSKSAQETIEQVAARLQTMLGLPPNSVKRSSRAPSEPEAGVLLEWSGGAQGGGSGYGAGEAEIDVDTGKVLTVLQHLLASSSPGIAQTTAELDAAASRFVSLLGWDDKALAAAGFGSGTGEVISNGDGTVEYAKTWKSHDAQGAPDGGLIDVRVDAAAGMLLSFYYRPGAQKRSPG